MTELAIEAIGLKKYFGGRTKGPFKKQPAVKALDGVDFKIKAGENYCLLGPNGAGKTTLIRALLGLLQMDGGTVRVLGHEMPSERDKLVSQIGYMPQDISLYPDLSVKESMNFFAKIFGLKKNERDRAVKDILNIFQLNRWQNTVVENLSGGMKRRLSLACTLIHNPKLVILDEPTVGVDPTLRLSFWDYFKELNDQGTTIITTTHIMDEAEKSKIIGFMRAGKFIAQGTLRELKKQVPGSRKLVVNTQIEDTQSLANKIIDEYQLTTQSNKFKLEILYDDDSIVDNLLAIIRNDTKIHEIQTVEPNLEDTFIYFSEKNQEGTSI